MRYHILIAYDICNSKRLQKVHRIMTSYGQAVQYSVFISQLSERDFTTLREKLKDIIHHQKDQVIMIKLGPVTDHVEFDSKWTVLGRNMDVRENNRFIY